MAFVRGNNIKVGDVCIFELVHECELLVRIARGGKDLQDPIAKPDLNSQCLNCRYEKEIRHPIPNLIGEELAEALLIQGNAGAGLILQANEINFAILAGQLLIRMSVICQLTLVSDFFGAGRVQYQLLGMKAGIG
ncbi:hypothetical protein Ahy_B06g083856 [Arachis hypogaea]|uniref:TF-B3 domain-containing protein n=1 Tax=Arachis hypogaea TaxID=3818 RepID=A0A444YQI4_ARAHY|nr:hypothetical protein Ahy_B06g083856 [Arachis hypogaea]